MENFHANFTTSPTYNISSDTIIKFIEKCDQLKEMTFHNTVYANPLFPEQREELEAGFGDKITITDAPFFKEPIIHFDYNIMDRLL